MKRFLIAVSACLLFCVNANAVPVNFAGTVINGNGGGGSWSWIHGCATPGGCNFYNLFKPNQGISGYIDLEEGELVAHAQTYDLYGTTDNFYMHELALEFDPVTGSLYSGELIYTFLGVSGTIDFEQMNMGLFNSLVFDMNDEDQFSAYLWGGDALWYGDETNGLGTDFAFTAQIPEPGTLGLLGLGLLSLVVGRRKRG